MQASEAKARHLCLRPLVTQGRAGGVAASHATEQAPDAPWGWRTRRRESRRRSRELCRKNRCCPPNPCEVGGLCASAYKGDVTSPVGTSACGVRACMRGVLAGIRARNHGHAPRAATMLPGAEAMPISFCNMVPAGPHVQDESIVSRPVIRMLPRCSCWYTKRKVLHGGGPAAVRTQLGSPRTARSCALPYLRARLSLQRFFRRFFVFRGKLPLSQKLMDIGLLTRKLVILARYVFERSNVDTPGSTAGSGPSPDIGKRCNLRPGRNAGRRRQAHARSHRRPHPTTDASNHRDCWGLLRAHVWRTIVRASLHRHASACQLR